MPTDSNPSRTKRPIRSSPTAPTIVVGTPSVAATMAAPPAVPAGTQATPSIRIALSVWVSASTGRATMSSVVSPIVSKPDFMSPNRPPRCRRPPAALPGGVARPARLGEELVPLLGREARRLSELAGEHVLPAHDLQTMREADGRPQAAPTADHAVVAEQA